MSMFLSFLRPQFMVSCLFGSCCVCLTPVRLSPLHVSWLHVRISQALFLVVSLCFFFLTCFCPCISSFASLLVYPIAMSSPCVLGLHLSVSCFILRALCPMLSVFSFASSCPIKSNSFQLFSQVFPLPWFPTCVCIYCVSFHLSFIGASVNLLIVLPCVF